MKQEKLIKKGFNLQRKSPINYKLISKMIKVVSKNDIIIMQPKQSID